MSRYAPPARGALPRLALFAAAGLLGACSHSPLSSHWPVAPEPIARVFSPLDADIPANARMSAIDTALARLLDEVGKEAGAASARDWGSGDVVTAGGLMAVLGGMAERLGLVNTGAAVGLVGGAGRARYQYPVQREAYRRAEAGLSCVQTQVRLLNDDYRVLVLEAGADDERASASRAPQLAIENVEKLRLRLLRELDAVGAAPPTRSDLEALAATQAKSATPTAPTSAASAANAVSVAKAASAQRKTTVETLRRSQAANAAAPAASTPTMSAPLRAWLNAVPYAGTDAAEAPSLPAEKDSRQAKWLVDDARGVAKGYAAELARCTL